MHQTRPRLKMIFLSFHTPRSIDHPLRKQLSFLRKHQRVLILQGKLVWFLFSEFLALLCEDLFVLSYCSLKNLLRTRANAFLSNDYYESNIAWMELVSILFLFSPFLCSYMNTPLVLILLLYVKFCLLLLCLLHSIRYIFVCTQSNYIDIDHQYLLAFKDCIFVFFSRKRSRRVAHSLY